MIRNVLGGLLCLAAMALGPYPARAQAARDAAPLPVAARDIPRGTLLEAADVAHAPGAAADPRPIADPVGWVTRRLVREGEVLRPPAVSRPDLVRAGDRVQLFWREGGLELRMRGRSMASAARGEKVSVRVDARRRFEGVVVDQGLVRLHRGDHR